jgi:ankyrin repeat protein
MLNAQNQYNNINNQISQVQQNLINIRGAIITYENQVRDLQTKYNLLNVNMADLKTEQNTINAQIAKVQERVSESRVTITNYEENLQNLAIEKNTFKVRLEQFEQQMKELLDLIPNIMAGFKKIEGWGNVNLGAQLLQIIPNKELENTDLFKELTKGQDEESFNKIIEKIGDINAQDKDGRTLLMHCLLNGFHAGTKKLLDMKADLNIYDKDGMNALLYSGQFPHIEHTKKIIQISKDVSSKASTCSNMNIGHLLVHNLHLMRLELGEDNYQYIIRDANWNIICGVDLAYLKVNNIKPEMIVFKIDKGQTNINRNDLMKNAPLINGVKTIGNVTMSGPLNLSKTKQEDTLELLKELHTRNPNLLNEFDDNVKNVYVTTLHKGYGDLALALVKEGLIDKDYERNGEFNILNDIFFSDSLDFFKMILELVNKDCNIVSSKNHSLIDYAAVMGAVKIMEFLIKEKNINPKLYSPAGLLPFHNGASGGHIKVLEFLKPYMTDINIVTNNPQKYSALHYACIGGKLEIVKKLIEWGANIYLKDYRGWTAFDCAADNGYLEIVKLLISSKVDVNSKDQNNMHSLDWACIKGHLEIAVLLIANGADVNLVSTKGFPPLRYAYDNGHSELAKKLIELGADINFESNGNRMINNVSWKDDVDMMKFLVEQKQVNPLDLNSLGVIPFHNAAALGSMKVLEFLKPYMKGKIDFPSANEKEFNNSALHYACLYSRFEVVKKLIEWGSNIDLQNGNGQTSLYLSLGQKNEQITQLLIDKGANINIAMNDGDTVMHMVGYYGWIDFGEQFIKKGMSVNIKNHKGQNPAMLVCDSKNVNIDEKKKTLEFFIKNGANLYLKDNEGKNLGDYVDLYFPEAKYLIANAKYDEDKESILTNTTHSSDDLKKGGGDVYEDEVQNIGDLEEDFNIGFN